MEEYQNWVDRFVAEISAAAESKEPEQLQEILDGFDDSILIVAPFRLDLMLFSRRLYLESKGYLGLEPGPTQPGDEIWILENARMPFILRPVRRERRDDAYHARSWKSVLEFCCTEQPSDSDDADEPQKQYQLIGECYVHGIMHQELFKAGDESEWPVFEEIAIV